MNDEHKDHDKVLASPPASHLGEIHWHILRASTQMHSQTTVKKPAGPTGKFVQYEQTEFGKEVGRDEINWWVFKKEANLDELREQTERALAATQVLKNTADALKEHRPETYEELLGILRTFADKRECRDHGIHDHLPSTQQNLSVSSLYCFNSTRISSTSLNCSPEWVTGGRICASSFFVSTSRVVPSAKVYLDFAPLIKYTTNGG
jgi:hypothetical protein